MFDADLVQQMLESAERAYPNEACGVLISEHRRPVLVPCPNVDERPGQQFTIDPNDYEAAEARGPVLGIFHSHVDESAEPSQADREMIEATQLPWHIVSWPGKGYSHTLPCGYVVPLEGRPFVHGIHDCYTIIRDFYKREYGIHLNDYPRKQEWWNDPEYDLYIDNFRNEGFVPLDGEPMVRGDVLLMRCGETLTTNHGAIYLGDGLILHHVTNRLSCTDVLNGYFRKAITHHLRHKDRLK